MNDMSNDDLAKMLKPRKVLDAAVPQALWLQPDSETEAAVTPALEPEMSLPPTSSSPSLLSGAAFLAEVRAGLALRARLAIVVAFVDEAGRESKRDAAAQELVVGAVTRAMSKPEAVVALGRRDRFLALLVGDDAEAAHLYCQQVSRSLWEDTIVDFQSKRRIRPMLQFGIANSSDSDGGLLALFRVANKNLQLAREPGPNARVA